MLAKIEKFGLLGNVLATIILLEITAICLSSFEFGPSVGVGVHARHLTREYHLRGAQPRSALSVDSASVSMSDIGPEREFSGAAPPDPPPRAWLDFQRAKQEQTTLPFPDFSGAGYRYGGRVPPDVSLLLGPTPADLQLFNVEDYGADGSDSESDYHAIMRAIDDIHEAGGGVLFFPAGRFLLRTENEYRDQPHGNTFVLRGDNIIVKGAGIKKTTLFMHYPIEPDDPTRPWHTTHLFRFEPDSADAVGGYRTIGGKILVSENARLGARKLAVADVSSLVPGDHIRLFQQEAYATSGEEFFPFHNDSHIARFNDFRENGVRTFLAYEIESIDVPSKTLLLRTGLARAVYAGAQTTHIMKMAVGQNCGVEDLTFAGDWRESFVHHGGSREGKSALRQFYAEEYAHVGAGGLSGNNIDDGWSAFNFKSMAHSWMRRVVFHNVSRGVQLAGSLHMTVYQVDFEGASGHFAASANNGGSWNLVADCHDKTKFPDSDKKSGRAARAGAWHTFGQSNGAGGNVFLAVSWPSTTTLDAHCPPSLATLYDRATGALGYDRYGGAVHLHPQFLDGLTFWNFESRYTFDRHLKSLDTFRFWDLDTVNNKVMPPVMVGYHGVPVEFETGQVVYDESHGQEVSVKSLYAAQMQWRGLPMAPELVALALH